MSRFIPNENSWVGFATAIADISGPTSAEVGAAIDLTSFIVTIDASTTGNQLPTPDISTLFETSTSGTVQASFSAEMYRDDTTDTAWETLPRGTDGFMLISRVGTAGAAPAATDVVEVWPITITARTATPLASNDVQRFSISASVTAEPDEAATVAA